MNNTAFSEIGQDFTVGVFLRRFRNVSGAEIGPGAVGPFSGTVFSLTTMTGRYALSPAHLLRSILTSTGMEIRLLTARSGF